MKINPLLSEPYGQIGGHGINIPISNLIMRIIISVCKLENRERVVTSNSWFLLLLLFLPHSSSTYYFIPPKIHINIICVNIETTQNRKTHGNVYIIGRKLQDFILSILCFILMITVMVVSMEPSEGLNVKSANPEPEVGCKEPVLLLTDRDDSSVVAPSAARH